MTEKNTGGAPGDLGVMEGKGFSLQATLVGHLPGVDPGVAQALMDTTHDYCPVSKAVGTNIPVTLEVSS